MQTLRERLTLLLLVLLPFHAFMVTVGTKLLAGPDHVPLRWLAMWKEGLLAAILALALYELYVLWRRDIEAKERLLTLTVPDWIVLTLLLLGVFISVVTHGNLRYFVYGVRYDFVPLIAFVILRRVMWSDWFVTTLRHWLIIVGGVVTGYGLLSLVLPQGVFTWLGYSDLHSLYLPWKPIAAYQQIGGTALRRMQSTMSGPNQLGLWLLIPLSIVLIDAVHCHKPASSLGQRALRLLPFNRNQRCLPLVLLCVFLAGVFFTFSRSAWIAAFVIVAVALHRHFRKRRVYRLLLRYGAICIFVVGIMSMLWPQILLRPASSRDHYLRPLEAVQTMVRHPLGRGLGTAGPASNRVSDPCIFLSAGADYSWTHDRPELCVFVDDEQVKPLDRICHCPNLPENWYLQIGVELGWLGFALYLYLIFFLLRRLQTSEDESLGEVVFLSLLGVSIAALVLHAWEDAAVAYTVWTLAAVALQRQSQTT